MRRTILIISIFLTINLFGQNPTEKVGKIEVQIIEHIYKHNLDNELTKKITNRKNRPCVKKYFDSSGTLLKAVSFGKHHYADLRLLNYIHIYQYDLNGIKSKIDIWETDYEKNLSLKYYETFDLDSTKFNIVSKKKHEVKSESIYTQTDYWYNKDGHYQGIFFDSTYYYKRDYNENEKLILFQQIYDGKLSWSWSYTYSYNERVGLFQTYYNDGDDYSTKEIQTYNNQGLLIEIEKVQISYDGIDEKTKIYYYDNGVIKQIEHYESFSSEKGYEMISYTDIKVKTRIRVDDSIAERINEQISIE